MTSHKPGETTPPAFFSQEKSRCPHPNFHVDPKVSVLTFSEERTFILSVTAKCTQCGVNFKFEGLEAGINQEKPTCSKDKFEARLPISFPMGQL